MTFKTIFKEIKAVPAERLDELYEYIHSLNPKSIKTGGSRKQILSFAGAFSNMSKKEYKDFIGQTKKTRSKLFDRHINL